jgi:predicted nucleic acid-binding protein
MSGSFLDTNVLLYLVSADTAKADRAEALVDRGGTISIQVLNELANVARRKMGFDWAETDGFLESVRALLDVVPLTVETHETGLGLSSRHGFSIYDAMIVSAALLAGCDRLWSEDMHNGLVIDGRLTIANPFGG